MSETRDRDSGAPAERAASPDLPRLGALRLGAPRSDGPTLDIASPETRQSLVARALSPMRRRSSGALVLGTRPPIIEEIAPDAHRGPRRAIIISLIAVVLLPILASGVYLFAFASDQYVAEMRFAVRKASAARGSDGVESSGGTVNSSSLLSGGASLASEDAEIVASYIHSRAVIDDVSQSLDVRALFQRPEADFWARLRSHPKIEQVVAYWKRMIGVYIEPSSGIVTVSVTAFRREDALVLARAILASSDRLANSLTLKMQADQINLAQGEVRRSEGGVRFALADLTAFRNAQRLIDPVESSKSSGKLLMDLIGDRIKTEGQLYVVQRAQGPDAPGINGIKARLQSINQHVGELQDQLAGDKAASSNMAATLSQFEELEVKKEFAEKLFDFSRQGLERAQLNAMGQSIYLTVFMSPALPQQYTYPARFTVFLLIALTAAMTWVSGATITASILDHRL